MIVPGSANPLFLALGGDPLDEIGRIEQSVRLRRAAAAMISRTPGAAGDRRKFTINLWIKLGDMVAQYLSTIPIFGTAHQGTDYGYLVSNLRLVTNQLQFISTDTVGGPVIAGTCPPIERDPGAWVNFHLSCDTAQATAAAGLKMWINGVAQTLTGTSWSQNAQTYVNAAVAQWFGRADLSSGGTNYSGYGDEYIAFPCIVDGQALDPTAFGMFHPATGQWRPRNKAAIRAAVAAGGGVRNGWGTNGVFLPFDSAASLTTLGYDRSQSDTDTTGNNFTATNISLTAGTTYDSMLDTPTNNYCVINGVKILGSGVTLSESNLTCSMTGNSSTFGSIPLPSSGEAYWEVDVTNNSGTQLNIGVCDDISTAPSNFFPQSTNGYAYSGAAVKYNVTTTAYGATFTNGDNIGVKYNADTRELTFFKNGVSQGVAFTLPAGITFFPAFGNGNAANSKGFSVNFGQRPFSYPGNQGSAKTLCAKNLPRPSVQNSKTAFVAVTDSGANIQTTLAAARASWGASDYIEIFKRRDPTAEGWRWRFSDDLANYLDSSGTAAKGAFPALGGASYVGYALRVGAAYGVATGRINHVNGVADVVADGLGKSRKMVILRNEAGSNWFVYHPDLTAGKLLYLNLTSLETTDASISAVNSSGFTVAAALASGTYRWVSLAESGVLKLFKDTGNGSADGVFDLLGLSASFFLFKITNTGVGNWLEVDSARDPYNPAGNLLSFNLPDAENSATGVVDLTSAGSKFRQSTYGNNASATYVGLAIGQPSRYANAR